MSGASGGKPDERRPRRRPSAAGTCGPWQSVPDRLVLREEVLDDPPHVGIDADELRRAPAGDDDRGEVGGSTSANATSTGHDAPGLLDVRVEVRLEVVHDELDRPRRRRRDVRLVAGLGEPVLHEHRLEVLGRVPREDQHLRHAGEATRP